MIHHHRTVLALHAVLIVGLLTFGVFACVLPMTLQGVFLSEEIARGGMSVEHQQSVRDVLIDDGKRLIALTAIEILLMISLVVVSFRATRSPTPAQALNLGA